MSKDYVTQISSNEYIEEDTTKSCAVYPKSVFASYKDCDEHFMKNILSTFDPPNLVPVWLTDNMENVTSKMTMRHLGNKFSFKIQLMDNRNVPFSGNSTGTHYEDLADGTELSDCPLPCTTTKTDTRLLAKYPTSHNGSLINLTFSSKVVVTRTDLLVFNLSSFFSELGGSMGLWLGLGIIQAMDLGVNWILPRITQILVSLRGIP